MAQHLSELTDIECWCGRGMVATGLYTCVSCLHDRALAFWKTMGLDKIPGE